MSRDLVSEFSFYYGSLQVAEKRAEETGHGSSNCHDNSRHKGNPKVTYERETVTKNSRQC